MTIAVYPSLPGLEWPVGRTEIWSTSKVESASGRRFARSNWTFPKHRYELSYAFLRENRAEFSAIVGFYDARRGSLEPFFFLDPTDHIAVDQVIGIGDGVTKSFQLARTRGNVTEPVFGKKTIESMKIDGIPTVSYTVSDLGLVTFTDAPGTGKLVSWSGEFYQYVAFPDDELETSEFAEKLFESSSVVFETVKP